MPASTRRIVAIARKEFVHIARDWRMIVAVLVMPLFQLLLFAYAISFDVRNVPAVVLDQDNTTASRAYVAGDGQVRLLPDHGRGCRSDRRRPGV